MVAVPASPHNCASCEAPLRSLLAGTEAYLVRHVCPACGAPQPVRADEDFFTAFGVERRLGQDGALLQKRFYELSRALHPDRFTTAGPDAKARSLERMSFVNESFRTLKDRALLREYVLKREEIAKPSVQAPLELAESWFEIQDLLMEDPAAAQARLGGFVAELAQVKARFEAELSALERQIDESGFERSLLEKLARRIQERNYLNSMERDVERMRQKVAS